METVVEVETMDVMQVIEGLRGLGVPIELSEAPEEDAFIEGVWIDRGVMYVHLATLRAPGDIFHEAGHLAIVPPDFRQYITTGDLEESEFMTKMSEFLKQGGLLQIPECPVSRALIQCSETEAMAWSYAAAAEIGYPTLKVFFFDEVELGDQPYEGHGEELDQSFALGCHMGINGMHHAGLCNMREFPKMKKWMQDARLS